MDSQEVEHGVQPVLEALKATPAEIASSTYYAHKTRPPSARSIRDEILTNQITQVHRQNFEVYGARKVWHEMLRQGRAAALGAAFLPRPPAPAQEQGRLADLRHPTTGRRTPRPRRTPADNGKAARRLRSSDGRDRAATSPATPDPLRGS